jgi:hypothetical protein
MVALLSPALFISENLYPPPLRLERPHHTVTPWRHSSTRKLVTCPVGLLYG